MVHVEVIYEKIAKYLLLRINHRKFRFKSISGKRFISIIKRRNGRRRKLIGKIENVVNERIYRENKAIKKNWIKAGIRRKKCFSGRQGVMLLMA